MEIQDIIQGLSQAEITAITSPDERSLIVNTTLNQAVIYVDGAFKQASFTDTDDIPEGTTNKYITTSDLSQITTNETNITSLQTGKEDAFTKNTAFNKDFGTSAGEVLEGDTAIIPEAPSDGKQYARKDAGWNEVTGGGDMLKSVYDPTGVEGDAFDYANAIGLTQSVSITHYTATGNINNFDFGSANVVFFDGDGSDRNFTGIAAPPAGVNRIVTLINVSPTHKIKLKNNVTSTAANRLLLRDNANRDMKKQDGCRFIYDHVASRWRSYGVASH